MKFTSLKILLILLIFFMSCKPEKQDNQIIKTTDCSNRECLLAATLWYQSSAEMRALAYQNFKLAKLKLQENSQKASCEKPMAIITDLDETVIDNSPFSARMIKHNINDIGILWSEWVKEEKATAMPGALEFLNYADSLGINIMYISNRADSLKHHTMSNLKKLNFPQVTEKNVILKKDKSDKTERRNTILKDYDVVLYMGDNLRDFSEVFKNRDKNYGKHIVDSLKNEFGERFIVFPNPMYGEWEKPLKKGAKGGDKRQIMIKKLDLKD